MFLRERQKIYSLLHYKVKSFNIGGLEMPKVTFKTDLCKGCGLCVDACPRKILIINKEKINAKGHSPAEMTDESKCIGCAFCATMCPDCIIKVEK